MKDVTLREALKDYETIYMRSRNFASRTRVEYINDLDDLVDFLESNGKKKLSQVGKLELDKYLAELDQRGYAGSTRRRKFSSVRSLFSFLHDDGYIDKNVAQKISPPKAESKEPRVLTEKEYKSLLRACSHDIRDAAIIELLLQTGIRLSELTKLTLNDIELPARIKKSPDYVGVLRIKEGKGRSDRTLPLNYKVCKALKAYLKVRPSVESNRLFISKFKEPLGPRGVQKAVHKYLDEAGIEGASVHSLRHTFGTHHVAKGTSLRSVQEALGHKDLKTTSVYVALAKDVLNREVQENAL